MFNKFQINQPTLILLTFNLRWYGEVMRSVLIRYKVLFVLLVALLVPSLSILKVVFVDPLRIFYEYSSLNLTQFIVALVCYEVLALIWLMIHDAVIFRQPWAKYISSLEISYQKNIFIDVILLLFLDVVIFLPLLFASKYALLESVHYPLIFLLNSEKTFFVIVTLLIVQLSCKYHKLIFLIPSVNILAILSTAYLPIGLQVLIFIMIPTICFFLIKNITYSLPKKIVKRKQKLVDGVIFTKSNALRVIIWKNFIDNFAQFSMIFSIQIFLLVISVCLLLSGASPQVMRITLSSVIFTAALCVSNFFSRLSSQWLKYQEYIKSLPIKKSLLLIYNFFIAFLFFISFNFIVISISEIFGYISLIPILLKTVALSILYLLISYYPQVKYPRHGLFVSFCLMVIFAFINYKYVSSLG